jgi:predicted hydrocarbon binding protein
MTIKKLGETKMAEEYFYPNIWGRGILTSAEEILGEKGVNALLNLSGLTQYIGNYPPDNIKKEFPFEHVAALQQGLMDMYGSKGARVFATRGGEETFNHSLDKYDKVQKAAKAAMAVGSFDVRLKGGLLFFAKFFNTVSDQKVRVEEADDHWKWIIERCPICWGRKADEPVCHLAVGVLNSASSWATGERLRIKAHECMAAGAKEGVLILEKPAK